MSDIIRGIAILLAQGHRTGGKRLGTLRKNVVHRYTAATRVSAWQRMEGHGVAYLKSVLQSKSGYPVVQCDALDSDAVAVDDMYVLVCTAEAQVDFREGCVMCAAEY